MRHAAGGAVLADEYAVLAAATLKEDLEPLAVKRVERVRNDQRTQRLAG